nr:hypothetical protein [uncultured archaeon]
MLNWLRNKIARLLNKEIKPHFKMNKSLMLLVVLALAALLIIGCQKDSTTGYATYGQQGQQQPYVGGGCGVAPVSDLGEAPLQVSEPSLAA